MDTCETCECWKATKFNANFGDCQSGYIENDEWISKRESCMMIMGADYGLYWMMGKDFGCIHHKMKGAEDDGTRGQSVTEKN